MLDDESTNSSINKGHGLTTPEEEKDYGLPPKRSTVPPTKSTNVVETCQIDNETSSISDSIITSTDSEKAETTVCDTGNHDIGFVNFLEEHLKSIGIYTEDMLDFVKDSPISSGASKAVESMMREYDNLNPKNIDYDSDESSTSPEPSKVTEAIDELIKVYDILSLKNNASDVAEASLSPMDNDASLDAQQAPSNGFNNEFLPKSTETVTYEIIDSDTSPISAVLCNPSDKQATKAFIHMMRDLGIDDKTIYDSLKSLPSAKPISGNLSVAQQTQLKKFNDEHASKPIAVGSCQSSTSDPSPSSSDSDIDDAISGLMELCGNLNSKYVGFNMENASLSLPSSNKSQPIRKQTKKARKTRKSKK